MNCRRGKSSGQATASGGATVFDCRNSTGEGKNERHNVHELLTGRLGWYRLAALKSPRTRKSDLIINFGSDAQFVALHFNNTASPVVALVHAVSILWYFALRPTGGMCKLWRSDVKEQRAWPRQVRSIKPAERGNDCRANATRPDSVYRIPPQHSVRVFPT